MTEQPVLPEWPVLPDGWTYAGNSTRMIWERTGTEVPPHGGHCRVYWGSHGCERERGHRGRHFCDPCHGHPWWLHAILRWAGLGGGCVERWPYYGRCTKFYGEDAEQS